MFDPTEEEDVAGALPGSTEPLPTNPDDLATPSFASTVPNPDLAVPTAPAYTAPQGTVPNATPNATPADPALALIQRQGVVDKANAQAKSDFADADTQRATEHQKLVNDAIAHGNQIFGGPQKKYDDALTKYQGAKLTDYWDDPSHSKLMAGLAIALGGLGAASRSAGGGSAQNDALAIIQKKISDDTERQKFGIEKMKDQVAMARTGLSDAAEAKRTLIADANAKEAATLGSLEAQLRQRLAKQGMAGAQIDADQRVQQLMAARQEAALKAKELAMKEAESAARVNYLNARSARANRSGPIGSGRGTSDAKAQLSKFATENPGDVEGLYRKAGQLGLGEKDVAAVTNKTKPTESEAKSASQASAGLRAVDNIEKSGYTPTKQDVQKWLDNQRKLQLASRNDSIGGLAAVGQSVGMLPQSEVDGLSPQAAEYFSNVRRLMEPLARAKSGAAISESEWTQFYNQYGPNSRGGWDAARNDLQDLNKLSGVAGKRLETNRAPSNDNGGTPAKMSPKMAAQLKLYKGPNADYAKWALQNMDDPRAVEVARKVLGQ